MENKYALSWGMFNDFLYPEYPTLSFEQLKGLIAEHKNRIAGEIELGEAGWVQFLKIKTRLYKH